MIDIHCHLLPGLDDGPAGYEQTLAMARMATDDGTHTIVVTPHQLGSYRRNSTAVIRAQIKELRQRLHAERIPLTVHAGADVRIEADLVDRIQADEVLTLADQGRHVLLELPHELYFPIEPVLDRLSSIGITGILSHPERNLGLLAEPACLGTLVDYGCLMQVTAGSFLGSFGRPSQCMAESMLHQGLVHFVASDGHGVDRRRPRLQGAYLRVAELADAATADDLFSRFPALVCQGQPIPLRRRKSARSARRWFALNRPA